MNWTTILADEARKNSILRLDDLAHRYNIREILARNGLRRYETRGLVEHIANKVYVNRFNQNFFASRACEHSATRLLCLSRVCADRSWSDKSKSGDSNLRNHWISEGFQEFLSDHLYRKISKELFWGFEEKRTRYNTYQIALPEKALLDWIYLSRQEGLPTPVDEIDIQFLNLRKLREFADKFPRTVQEVVNQLLLDHTIAA